MPSIGTKLPSKDNSAQEYPNLKSRTAIYVPHLKSPAPSNQSTSSKQAKVSPSSSQIPRPRQSPTLATSEPRFGNLQPRQSSRKSPIKLIPVINGEIHVPDGENTANKAPIIANISATRVTCLNPSVKSVSRPRMKILQATRKNRYHTLSRPRNTLSRRHILSLCGKFRGKLRVHSAPTSQNVYKFPRWRRAKIQCKKNILQNLQISLHTLLPLHNLQTSLHTLLPLRLGLQVLHLSLHSHITLLLLLSLHLSLHLSLLHLSQLLGLALLRHLHLKHLSHERSHHLANSVHLRTPSKALKLVSVVLSVPLTALKGFKKSSIYLSLQAITQTRLFRSKPTS